MIQAVAIYLLPSAVLAAVMVGLASWMYRRAGAAANRWARARGLALSDENRPMVVGYLRASRMFRFLGMAAGFVIPPLAVLALGKWPPAWEYGWPMVVFGYLAGIVCAEVTLRRPRGRRASVRPRGLRDYLSSSAVRAQRATAACAGVLAGAALAVPMREPVLASRWSRAAVLVGVVVVFTGVEVVERWLVRRPQPVVSVPLLAADDAIRRQSVHSIAGAGMGMQWLLAGAAMIILAGSDLQLLRWTMWEPAMLSWMVAFVACGWYDWGVPPVRTSSG